MRGPSCMGFCSVPGPLQTVQKADFWSVILALQAAEAIGGWRSGS